MTDALLGLYFHDPRAFVVPVEHLTDEGMSAPFAKWLRKEHEIDEAWIALFDRAFSLYRERASELNEKDPDNWFPARKQNICVVLDAERTRPFYLPFNKASWLLYASDFDPEISHHELATYLLLHTERLCLAQNPAVAVAHNLGYWLLRSDEEIEAFRSAANRATRPDASAFRALANAMDWVRRLRHPKLEPLEEEPDEPVGQLPQTGIIATASMQPLLVDLVAAFRSTVGEVAKHYFERFAGEPAASTLVDWIAESVPEVLVTAHGGEVVWDPGAPGEVDALTRALGEASAEIVASIRADLEVADARTRRFMQCLKTPAALPLPSDDIEQSGLTYIHATRKRIAYNLHEPGMNRCLEPSAPYERLMLGARTMHEWGHLAVDAGWVHLPESRRSEHARALVAFADALEDIVSHAPNELASVRDEELALTGADSLGVGLRDVVLERMPDYMANVLARELLPSEEMETYVRQQVTTLVQEDLGPFGQLARYAYELQYMTLSGVDDPMAYFFESTWFREMFIEPGIVTRERFETLVEAMRAICACYAIDDAAIQLTR
jgi:hypothetical protein